MPDPNLVSYLRKNWKKFGPESLRESLIREGLAEEEVAAAIAEATPKPKRPWLRPHWIVLIPLLFVLLVVILIALAMREDSPSSSTKHISTQEEPGDSHQAFFGRYGYVLRLPSNYNAISDFKDADKTIELVYIFPKDMDLNNLRNEIFYEHLGILRLEVRPKRLPEGRLGVDALRNELTASLVRQKMTYSLRETLVGGLQGIVVDIRAPSKQSRAFVIGGKVLYTLVGGSENQIFKDTLASLRELALQDHPIRP